MTFKKRNTPMVAQQISILMIRLKNLLTSLLDIKIIMMKLGIPILTIAILTRQEIFLLVKLKPLEMKPTQFHQTAKKSKKILFFNF
jgi:hypothetical protein